MPSSPFNKTIKITFDKVQKKWVERHLNQLIRAKMNQIFLPYIPTG